MQATAPLVLPDGTTTQVSGDARDLSVFGALVASGGVWEPHVVELFRALVRPSWLCMDIGANLGAHTLTLASLARRGRVIAFEAGTTNAVHLRRNVAALPRGSAEVDVQRLALWDRPGQLHLAMIEQLAGCAFLSERGPEMDEQLIRSVVTSEQVRQTPLELSSDAVDALPLDDWVRSHGIRRVDLIKIDVEGAETRVLEGARQVLERFRPVLVTEYNPSCAATYWGQPPSAYFELLAELFSDIRIIEPDGSLSDPVTAWDALEDRLGTGKGWEDLCCRSGGPPRRRRRGWRRLSRR